MTRDHDNTPIEPRTRLLTALVPTGMPSPILKPGYQWPAQPATPATK
jgi:hypothetical protein